MDEPTATTDGEMAKRLAAIEYAEGSIAHIAPGRDLANELIADRRAEASVAQTEVAIDEGGGAA